MTKHRITVKLSDSDAQRLNEVSRRLGKTQEDVIIDAIRLAFVKRLSSNGIFLSEKEFNGFLDLISQPETDKSVLEKRKRLLQTRPVWEDKSIA